MKNIKIKTGLKSGAFEAWHQNQDYPGDLKRISFDFDNNEYLHFAGLRLFSRIEDAEKGQQVSVFEDEIIITENIAGNPSRRRDAVSLYFYAECGPNIKMNLIQHKGQTLVEFEKWDGNKPEIN